MANLDIYQIEVEVRRIREALTWLAGPVMDAALSAVNTHHTGSRRQQDRAHAVLRQRLAQFHDLRDALEIVRTYSMDAARLSEIHDRAREEVVHIGQRRRAEWRERKMARSGAGTEALLGAILDELAALRDKVDAPRVSTYEVFSREMEWRKSLLKDREQQDGLSDPRPPDEEIKVAISRVLERSQFDDTKRAALEYQLQLCQGTLNNTDARWLVATAKRLEEQGECAP